MVVANVVCMSRFLAVPLLLVLVAVGVAAPTVGADGLVPPVRSAALDAAVDAALDGLAWVPFDMHLHTDHSSDGGVFHQEFDTPESHDTFLDEQRDQALRAGMSAVAFTDHRNFAQHYDPDFDLDRSPFAIGDRVLLTGEEWGGGRHGTAFAIQTRIDHGSTDRVGCGLAEMTLEVAAQDGLLGMAHPKDGGADGCMAELVDFPLSHIEALRGGDSALQDAGFPSGGNGSNEAYYQALAEVGGRVAAVNGSDNHFKQVWAGPSGPGGSAAYVLTTGASEEALVDGIRAGRTLAGQGITGIRIATLLVADGVDGFEAVTGGWAEPIGDTVTLALAIENGAGHTVRVVDDTGAVVAEVVPDGVSDTVAFELPSSSAFYRVAAMTVGASRVGLPDPLDYVDTFVMNSTPVWLSAPTSAARTPALADGTSLGSLTDADWGGFADLARHGDVVHLVQQQRTGDRARVVTHQRSLDGGMTWSPAVPLGEGRSPSVVVREDTVTVAFEVHDPRRFGGDVVVRRSTDGGVSFGPAEAIAAGNAARPVLAAGDSVDHVVWQAQVDDGTWAIHHQRLDGGSSATRLSFAQPWSGGMTQYAVPPRELLHIPASVEPTVAVHGDTVAVAWEDNREDPTPGRSGNPDDVAIFGAVSTDGGVTFSADSRWTERVLRRDEPTAEGVEGNPALSPSLAVTPDGGIVVAHTSTVNSAFTDVWVQRSDDLGATWSTARRVDAPSEWSYQPQLQVEPGGLRVVWQQATDPTWSLRTAVSTDGGLTFGSASTLTGEGRYHGWPALTDGMMAWTAELPGGVGVVAAELG